MEVALGLRLFKSDLLSSYMEDPVRFLLVPSAQESQEESRNKLQEKKLPS